MSKLARAVAGFTAFCVAGGAQAQSTAETYLQEFIELYAAQGFALEFAEKNATGDGLELSGVVMRMENDQSQMQMSIDSMTFVEIDDPVYEVEIRTSPAFAGTVTTDPGDGPITFDFEGTMAGVTRLGGPADDRVIGVDYQTIALNYNMPMLDSEGGSGTMQLTASELGGTLGYSLALATQVYDMTIGNAALSMDMVPPDGGEMDLQVTYTDVTLVGEGPIADMTDPANMFSVDGDLTMRLDSGPYTSSMKVDSPDGAFDLISNGATSFLGFAGGRGQLDYSFGGTGLKLIASGSTIPLPQIEADIAETDMRFALPVAPTDGKGKAAVRINLDGVSVSDQLWGMVDPGSVIPRDPAKILLDLEGNADVDVNLMDPDNAMAMMGMPFTFQDAVLKALEVSFGGASVTGSGEAVMNNDGPFPMPVGGIDLRIAGINGLLEKLGQIGIVPPEQAMPVRMMLGMFAQPTDEADVFTTRIEAGADGSITANGVPLQ